MPDNPFTPNQRLIMLLANCGFPGKCVRCFADIRTVMHIDRTWMDYDFSGPNEGSPHECGKEKLQ